MESSVRQKLSTAESSLMELLGNLREYKKLVECYRADISSMENSCTLAIEDITTAVQPEVEQVFNDLQKQIQQQKESNEHLQKQVTLLKKEKSITQQNIIRSNNKMRIQEEHVGHVKRR